MALTASALADTSLLIARESGRWLHESNVPERLAVSVITIGELRAGVLSASDAAVAATRLDTYSRALQLEALDVDDEVAEQWARLRSLLRASGRRMPVNDSWIAATAVAHGVPVVTQDADYDVDIAGLDVIRV